MWMALRETGSLSKSPGEVCIGRKSERRYARCDLSFQSHLNFRQSTRVHGIAVALIFLWVTAAPSLGMAVHGNEPEIPPEVAVRGDVERVAVVRTERDGERERTPLTSAYFDREGRLVARDAFSEGVFQWKTRFEYDSSGRLVSWESRDAEGRLQWEYRYRYDDYGRLEQETSYDSTGDRDGMQTYEYDRYNLLEESMYSGDGALQWSRIYEYEDDLTVRRWRMIYPDGGAAKTTTEYTDRFGRIVREVHLDETEQAGEVIRHDYDAVGRRVRTTVETTDGEMIRGTQRSYTDRGDLEREVRQEVRDESTIIRDLAYDYDSNGNWTRRRELRRVIRGDVLVRQQREVIEREIEYFE